MQQIAQRQEDGSGPQSRPTAIDTGRPELCKVAQVLRHTENLVGELAGGAKDEGTRTLGSGCCALDLLILELFDLQGTTGQKGEVRSVNGCRQVPTPCNFQCVVLPALWACRSQITGCNEQTIAFSVLASHALLPGTNKWPRTKGSRYASVLPDPV